MKMKMKIGIVGLGFVGSAIEKSFTEKGVMLVKYDKYKNGSIGKIEDCYNTDILFLCLPTLFQKEIGEYDKSAIYEICDLLNDNKYKGAVIIKSTVEPETTNKLSKKYELNFVHNPEFLTARTAYEDFHNQKHIVLGKTNTCDSILYSNIINFYSRYYPEAQITLCKSLESESMKSFINSYYSVKVQFFTELYLLCQKNGADYNKIKDMMLINGWINPMHTTVPGPDGQISYGGACFPKDTNALNKYMEKYGTPNNVLNATINERDTMRNSKL